ncbi:MAG: phosphoribosylformylglycinamidine synthase subunit PurS [Acidimicrobiia bacterium]
MPTFSVRVDVSHLPGILDPQGAQVERALPALGFDGVSKVSIGKMIQLEVDAPSEAAARAEVESMCEKLLANPVIETFMIHINEAATNAAGLHA